MAARTRTAKRPARSAAQSTEKSAVARRRTAAPHIQARAGLSLQVITRSRARQLQAEIATSTSVVAAAVNTNAVFKSPIVSARSPPQAGTPASIRSVHFAPTLQVEMTHSPCDYNRRMPASVVSKRKHKVISRDHWMRILTKLDEFKLSEMRVHSESRANIRLCTKDALRQFMKQEACSAVASPQADMSSSSISTIATIDDDDDDASFANGLFESLNEMTDIPSSDIAQSCDVLHCGEENGHTTRTYPASTSRLTNKSLAHPRLPFSPFSVLGTMVNNVKSALISPFRHNLARRVFVAVENNPPLHPMDTNEHNPFC